MLPIKAILHPTDFSTHSKYAFRLACSVAKEHHARLIVMHVPPAPRAFLYEGVPVVQQLDEQEADLEAKLHALRCQHCKLPIEYRMEKGVAAEEILRVAQETNCDLIMMGTHGRTGLGRLLIGSVAERVLREANCPVLTVKAPKPQEIRVRAKKQKESLTPAETPA